MRLTQANEVNWRKIFSRRGDDEGESGRRDEVRGVEKAATETFILLYIIFQYKINIKKKMWE